MTAVAGRTSHGREPVAAFGHVTAVLVSHDGAGWLPQVVAALGSQTRLPDAWVAVDTGSSDDSPRLLTDALGPDHVVEAPADTAYATAVAFGLEHRPPPGDGWIWLLHDDSAPAPGALEALLDEAASASDIAVVGAKTREWPSLRRLLEVGVTLTGTGRRETGLEPGEPDQGQHDRPRDVLAVGTAGMLVRADVWRALGGLDPAFGLGDDLDLGWRVARAGQRVRIAPEAVVFHVEAAARDRRTTGALRGPARRERRRAALLVLLANCRRTVLPVQLVRLFAGSLLRALGLLLLKAPRDAWAELRAVAGVYARPLKLWRARRARRRTATVGAGQVRHLLPPVWAPYRSGIARVAEVASAVLGSSPAAVPRGTASETGPVAEEAEVLPSEPGLLTRLAARPLATTSAVLLLLTLLALRGLLTGGELQGGALLPAPDGSGVWWAEYLASWHPVGVGSTAVAPPYALLLAGLGVLTLGDAGALVSLLLVLAVPASALSAHLLLRRLGVAAPARLWASFAYAGLPLLNGALAQGRLGTVLATVWLPVVATAVLGLARSRPDAEGGLQLWTRRMRAGLALGILVTLVPVAYLLALVVAVGLLVGSLAAAPALRPASAAVSGAVVLAAPWLVAPWWLLDRMRNPANWFWEAGLPDADVGSVAPSVTGLVLGQPTGGTVGLVGWLGAGVVLAAVLALVRTDSRPTVAGAWCVAVAGLVLAIVGAGRTVDLPGGPAPVWVGFCLVVWWGGLLVAAAAAARDLREQLSGRSFGWRQPTVVAVAVAAVVGPPLALAVQVAEGVDGPLHRAAASPLPSYLVDDASTGRHTATLLVAGSLADGLGLTLVHEDGWRLGEEPFIGAAGSATVSGALRDLLVSPQTDSVRTLARWGIGYLYVPGPVDPDVAAALDTSPGLVRSGASTGDRAWQLDQLVGQVQSLDAGDDAVGKGVPLQSAGADGGPPWEVLLPKPRPAMVSLAAAPDDGWRASLGGARLRSTDAADVQAFSLGTATGGAEELDLVIEHRTARPWWVAAQIAALVVVVVLAAPTRGEALVTPARLRPAAVLGAVAVVVALAALAFAGLRPGAAPVVPASTEPGSRTVGADATICAAFPLDPGEDGTASDVGVVAPADSGSTSPGKLRVVAAEEGGRPLLTLDQRGAWESVSLAADEATDLLVEASGGLGVGAASHTAQRLPDTAGGGLAVQRCAAPARQWWFVGAGSTAERDSTMLLSNVDDSDAVVDVVLRGAEGPLETTGAQGVRVGAGQTVDLRLFDLVAGEDDVALEVVATQGRVVAAVSDDWSGVDVVGSDWLPVSPAPAETVLLPGVLDPGPRSRLVVANASESATPVDVSLVDDSGTFLPTNAPNVVAPAGGVVSVRLPDVGAGAALLVEADTPVTAAVRIGTDSDVGYAVQGPQLDGPTVVPVDLGRSLGNATLRLHLAAVLDREADTGTETPPARRATVAAYDADGTELAGTDVEVGAGTAAVVDPVEDLELSGPEREDVAYFVVTPDDPGERAGPLLGTAVMLDRAGRVALLPLDTGVIRVVVPVVTPSVVPQS